MKRDDVEKILTPRVEVPTYVIEGLREQRNEDRKDTSSRLCKVLDRDMLRTVDHVIVIKFPSKGIPTKLGLQQGDTAVFYFDELLPPKVKLLADNAPGLGWIEVFKRNKDGHFELQSENMSGMDLSKIPRKKE